MPIVGIYAGVGGAVGFLCTVLLALRAEDAWTAFTLVSALFGLAHTAIRTCVSRSRAEAHTSVAPRDTAPIGPNPLATASGKTIVLVGAITGAVLGILLSALLKSPFVWHCIALGIFVSVLLSVGARIAAWGSRRAGRRWSGGAQRRQSLEEKG